MITRNCDICNAPFSGKSEDNIRRAIGFHKSKAHGVRGLSSTPEGRRRAARQRHWRLAGHNDAQIKQMESEYQRKHSTPSKQQACKSETEVVPMALDKCPCCGARFYVAK